ncbi:hypothetical protein [Bradyrhizobium pachyrhizi]|nr:hypothetical protein [Bradyrhizobium pachyrhizi]
MRSEINIAESDLPIATVIVNGQIDKPLAARARNQPMDELGR